MQLIENWRSAWKMFSVQANAIGSSLSLGYAGMYDQLKDNFPPKYMLTITAAVFILGFVGRLIHQEAVEEAKKDTPK